MDSDFDGVSDGFDWSQWVPDATVAVLTGLLVSIAVILGQRVLDGRRSKMRASADWAIARRAIQRAMARDWSWMINQYDDFGARAAALDVVADKYPLRSWLDPVSDSAIQETLDVMTTLDISRGAGSRVRLAVRDQIAMTATRAFDEDQYIKGVGARLFQLSAGQMAGWIEPDPVRLAALLQETDRMLATEPLKTRAQEFDVAMTHMLEASKNLEESLRN